MEHVITEFRHTARRCREFSKRFNLNELEGSGRRELTRTMTAAAEEALSIHDHILRVLVHQLDAVLARQFDETLASKFAEVVTLLRVPVGDSDDSDDADAHFDFLAGLTAYGLDAFPGVAERLEHIAASLSVLLLPSAAVHHTTITNSNIGAVAVGTRGRAQGSATPMSGRRRRK